VLMYLSAIAAFSVISRRAGSSGPRSDPWKVAGACVRLVGLVALLWLAFVFRGAKGQHIITLVPFSLDTEWYGILGLIGWAYLVTSTVFLVFQTNRTAILGCMVLLMCLFAADKSGAFDGFWLNQIVGIGGTLGSLPAIAAGGLLLGSLLATTDGAALKVRTRFTLWFVAACVAAALLLHGLYGISKNAATPSWCLWACAITAALWYGFYWFSDVRPVSAVSRPLELAGQNVLLAYLISEMLPGLLQALHLGGWYGSLATSLPSAIARSTACGVLVLLVSTGLNRLGFRLKL
jgi:heparan-alpha-glucosaminide N-acetyltransferase